VPFSETKIIWVALALACFLLFGDAYAFDNPMALQSTIQEEMDLSNLQFNMLYSIYSLPNIILPFFGGILIDKIGVRVSILIFSTVLIFGQGIVVAGGYSLSYMTMLIGRGIFGMGSESLNAA
jgi:MFS family permease